MKKLLALLLAMILCFGLISCGGNDKADDADKDDDKIEKEEKEKEKEEDAEEDEADDEDEKPDSDKKEDDDKKDESDESSKGPLLYKVTDDDGDVVWLFGSIHIGREDFYPLPDAVLDAYESSDALAVEFDVTPYTEDPMLISGLLYNYMYLDGSTIKDHIDEDLYDRCVEILEEHGYYNAMFDYFDISMWESFVSDCVNELILNESMSGDLGIDMYFINRAHEEDKEIIDIESMELQMDIIPSLSEETQIFLLESTVESYELAENGEMTEMYEEMMDFWASGDEEAFAEYLKSEGDSITDRKEKKMYEEYNTAMVTDRNIAMAEFAMEALEDGEELFICVGAAHVVGEDAMADLLEEEGYTVELVR